MAINVPVLDIKNLSIIPNFDGNPNKLHRFIKATESILTHYYDPQDPDSFQNILLLNGILNKLEGRAEEVVCINGTTTWEIIKNTLIQNFGDQRDENCLNQDLVNLRQKPNETPYQFHEKVIHILNTICNYIELHSNETQRDCKRDFFTKQALKTFLAGLREPLGPIIRAMRPTTLAQALQFISEEDNIKYFQKSYQNPTTVGVVRKPNLSQPHFYNPSFNQNLHNPPRPMSHPNQNSNQISRIPTQVQRPYSSTNPQTPRYFTNPPFSRKPNNWSNNRPPMSHNTNISNNSRPIPMSTTSRYTTSQSRNPNDTSQNTTRKLATIPEQLYNADIVNEQCEENNYDNQYCEDEQAYYEYSCPDSTEQNENFQEDQYTIDET